MEQFGLLRCLELPKQVNIFLVPPISRVQSFMTSGIVLISVLKRAFQVFDINGDGEISVDELREVMNKCGMFPTNLELCYAMNQGDADRKLFFIFL